MFFQSDVVTPFATGAAAGLGHVFGQRFMSWLLGSWRWLSGKAQDPGQSASVAVELQSQSFESLLRKVNLSDLAQGIPEGCQLCRFKGTTLQEKSLTVLPASLSPDESLWLVPAGEILVTAGFPAEGMAAQAEVALEFAPNDGLAGLLVDGMDFNRNWLASLVEGSLLGVLSMTGKQSGKAFVAGDLATAAGCRDRLDQALQARGIRCRRIRSVGAQEHGHANGIADCSQAAQEPSVQALTREVAQVKTAADWEKLIESLKVAGVPFDSATARELHTLRDAVIQKAVQPEQAVTGLGQMTIRAFERAGIEPPDLERWATISDRLSDEYSDQGSSPATTGAAVNISVATRARPWTWHVWSRVEVDRRLKDFTRRTVNNCRTACERALVVLRDIPSLRQVRDLKGQLDLLDDLLSTIPPLERRNAALKIDTYTAKGLVKSLEEAVLVTEGLAKQTDLLLNQLPSSVGWQEAYHTCSRSVSKLMQLVKDRRSVR